MFDLIYKIIHGLEQVTLINFRLAKYFLATISAGNTRTNSTRKEKEQTTAILFITLLRIELLVSGINFPNLLLTNLIKLFHSQIRQILTLLVLLSIFELETSHLITMYQRSVLFFFILIFKNSMNEYELENQVRDQINLSQLSDLILGYLI